MVFIDNQRTLGVLGRSHDTFTDVTKLIESFGFVDIMMSSIILMTCNSQGLACKIGQGMALLHN